MVGIDYRVAALLRLLIYFAFQETYMVVMRNVFSGSLKIHKKYDLKEFYDKNYGDIVNMWN